MSFRIVPLAFLALALVACGSETPVQSSVAGGDPGTKPAPTATATKTAKPKASILSGASFRTPSERLACATVDGDGGMTLVCDVRPQEGDEGFPKPDAAITDTCEEIAASEWANGVSLPPTESAYPNCSSDGNVTDQHPPVLAYGATWSRDGYVCRSAQAGLTRTRGDHRFFANRYVIETR